MCMPRECQFPAEPLLKKVRPSEVERTDTSTNLASVSSTTRSRKIGRSGSGAEVVCRRQNCTESSGAPHAAMRRAVQPPSCRSGGQLGGASPFCLCQGVMALSPRPFFLLHPRATPPRIFGMGEIQVWQTCVVADSAARRHAKSSRGEEIQGGGPWMGHGSWQVELGRQLRASAARAADEPQHRRRWLAKPAAATR